MFHNFFAKPAAWLKILMTFFPLVLMTAVALAGSESLTAMASTMASRADNGYSVVPGTGMTSIGAVARVEATQTLTALRSAERDLQRKYNELERHLRAIQSPDVQHSNHLYQRTQSMVNSTLHRILALESGIKLVQESASKIAQKRGMTSWTGKRFPQEVGIFRSLSKYRTQLQRPHLSATLVSLATKQVEASSNSLFGTKAFHFTVNYAGIGSSTWKAIENATSQIGNSQIVTTKRSRLPIGLEPSGVR